MRCAATGLIAALCAMSASASGAPCAPAAPAVAWTASHDGPGTKSDSDSAGAVAFDAAGNCIVVGYEDRTDFGQSADWLVRKYSSLGALLWSRSYNSPADDWDAAFAVACDAAGNVVVAGMETRSDVAEGINWLVRKYDPGGALLWSRSYNHPATFGLQDQAWAVAIDGAGAIVVAGEVYEDGEQLNLMVRKYDAAGTVLWSRTFNNSQSNDDAGYGVALDGAGNILVAGIQDDPNGIGTAYDWALWKFDGAGNPVWSLTDTGKAGLDNEAWRVVPDAAGNIIVAGYDTGATSYRDWEIRKYGPTGALIWRREFSGPGAQWDQAYGLAVNGDGTALVGGRARFATDDFLIQAIDPAGRLAWSVMFDAGVGGSDQLNGLALGGAGRLAAVGSSARADLGEGDNVHVRAYAIPPCPPEAGLPALGAGVVPYPNPVPDDRVSIALDLAEDAVRVEVEIINAAMQRVRRAVWTDVMIADGGVVMDDMRKIMPGVYLLRVRAIQADGDEQRFAPVRLVIQRTAAK